MPNFDQTFKEFAQSLSTRLTSGIHTTEDAIRYTFFLALITRSAMQPHEIILEYPHPNIKGAEIDTYIPSFLKCAIAIEFKYDRNIPSKSSVPRPQNAGELFKDMCRLSEINTSSNTQRILVYCTDNIMATYFANPKNNHAKFFGLRKNERIKVDAGYLRDKPDTFSLSMGCIPAFELECLWTESLPSQHELRIYEVNPIRDDKESIGEGQNK
jgi:hypothetical protein